MASLVPNQSSTTSIFLHFLAFSLLLSPSLSEIYSINHLDVSSSVRSTLDLFTLQEHDQFFQNQNQNQEQDQLSSSYSSIDTSSFSLKIHPRTSLHLAHHSHKDYKSLTESRLARDSARVDSLITKSELAVRGISRADLNRATDFTAPLRSGADEGSGEYFTRLGLGTPSKPYLMVIDTGSDVSWLQCKPCSDCYKQSDPIFDPAATSTYSPLPCQSPLCRALEIGACSTRGACLYQVSYGDGSYTVGNLATETVSFSGGKTVGKVAVGCGHDNEGLFVGSAGLLGLGGGALSLPSQIKATSFSYCLVDRDSRSTSTLEFNPIRPGRSAVTAPIIKNPKLDTFYYIELAGISVGGKPVSIPPALFSVDESGSGGVIVDSGTAITRLPTQAYNSVRDAFAGLTRHLKKADGFAIFDTCYDFSALGSVKVPTVAMEFYGGGKLELPAKNYLIPVDSAGTFCFAFAETTSSMSIIGNVQQQGTRVHYDLVRSQVAFSLNSC